MIVFVERLEAGVLWRKATLWCCIDYKYYFAAILIDTLHFAINLFYFIVVYAQFLLLFKILPIKLFYYIKDSFRPLLLRRFAIILFVYNDNFITLI